MNLNGKVTDYITNAPAEQTKVLETLRQLIHKTISETTEDLKWGIPVFSRSKIFTYLRSTKHHVALGFYNIDRIDDPKGLLAGTGKNMRHLKIKEVEDIDSQLIARWLKATAE